MTVKELLDRFAGLRVYVREGRRAPNKPATLLWALGRVADPGAARVAVFSEVESKLSDVLAGWGAVGSAPSYVFVA